MFKDVNLDIAANILLAVAANNSKWTLYDVYNPSFRHHGTLRALVLGNYSRATGFQLTGEQSKYARRKDMKEIRFKSQIVVSVLTNESNARFIVLFCVCIIIKRISSVQTQHFI